jgi:hypothetical protein
MEDWAYGQTIVKHKKRPAFTARGLLSQQMRRGFRECKMWDLLFDSQSRALLKVLAVGRTLSQRAAMHCFVVS